MKDSEYEEGEQGKEIEGVHQEVTMVGLMKLD